MPPKGNLVSWKWSKGPEILSAAFGDPSTAHDYSLCLYDGDVTLLSELRAPAAGTCAGKPCWKGKGRPAGSKGWVYADKALTPTGVTGSVFQMLNHGLSTGGLFLLVGMIYERRHTRRIADFGGLWSVVPVYSACFLLIMLASVGLPGLNGFVGEFLILLGAFAWDPRFAAVAATGVILSATYMLWMFQRVNYGPVTNDQNAALPDLSPREWTVLVPIVALTVLMGIVPNLFLRPIEPSVDRMLGRIRSGAPVEIQAAAPPRAT